MNAITRTLTRTVALRAAILLLLSGPSVCQAQQTTASAIDENPEAAAAIQRGPIEPGDEIRLRWSIGSQYGFGFDAAQFAIAEVVDYQADHLLLRRGSRLFTVPIASVQSLERRVGTKPASAPAMVKASALGFTVGFAAGALAAHSDPSVPGDEVVDAGLVGGVLLGAPIGAFVAWLASRRRGIYEKVPFDGVSAGLAVARSGQFGLRVTIPGR